VPPAVRDRIEHGRDETFSFDHVRNIVVGSNRLAVDAAAVKARSLGYRTARPSPTFRSRRNPATCAQRPTRPSPKKWPLLAAPFVPPHCVISGGETTVTVRGSGLGAAIRNSPWPRPSTSPASINLLILSAGTDGTDGPTDAAGAIADGTTIARARTLGLDAAAYLAANDSYHFFEPLGDLIKTGPTGTNVMDIHLLLAN